MKTEILTKLRNAEGYISGQELCGQLGVSRTAVWKVMNQLKEEGYGIEAVQNKGYRITQFPDIITESELASRKKLHTFGGTLCCFDELDSTNNYAKKNAEALSHGTLVTADYQSHGKGRRGRGWTSEKGTGIFMSLLLKPGIHPINASMLTLVMALAVTKAIRRLYNLEAMIKWPNDIVINGKKVCGILTEMSVDMDSIQYIVIGVGINANMLDFPEELQERAVSVAQLLGHPVNRGDLIIAVMEEFEKCYTLFEEKEDLSGLKEEYNLWLINQGREVEITEAGNAYRGIALGITNRGELIVERQNGEKTLVYAGEVSVRGIYGYV